MSALSFWSASQQINFNNIVDLYDLSKTIMYMVQLHVTNETMVRMKKIVGIDHVKDGDYLVNELIDILEKKNKKIYT